MEANNKFRSYQGELELAHQEIERLKIEINQLRSEHLKLVMELEESNSEIGRLEMVFKRQEFRKEKPA
jgi:chromosome segregation ATPase